MVFTSSPPVVAMTERRDSKWRRRRSSAAPSPIRSDSSVEPTRSVNSTVTSPDSAMAPLPLGVTLRVSHCPRTVFTNGQGARIFDQRATRGDRH